MKKEKTNQLGNKILKFPLLSLSQRFSFYFLDL